MGWKRKGRSEGECLENTITAMTMMGSERPINREFPPKGPQAAEGRVRIPECVELEGKLGEGVHTGKVTAFIVRGKSRYGFARVPGLKKDVFFLPDFVPEMEDLEQGLPDRGEEVILVGVYRTARGLRAERVIRGELAESLQRFGQQHPGSLRLSPRLVEWNCGYNVVVGQLSLRKEFGGEYGQKFPKTWPIIIEGFGDPLEGIPSVRPEAVDYLNRALAFEKSGKLQLPDWLIEAIRNKERFAPSYHELLMSFLLLAPQEARIKDDAQVLHSLGGSRGTTPEGVWKRILWRYGQSYDPEVLAQRERLRREYDRRVEKLKTEVEALLQKYGLELVDARPDRPRTSVFHRLALDNVELVGQVGLEAGDSSLNHELDEEPWSYRAYWVENQEDEAYKEEPGRHLVVLVATGEEEDYYGDEGPDYWGYRLTDRYACWFYYTEATFLGYSPDINESLLPPSLDHPLWQNKVDVGFGPKRMVSSS
ncbi:hypothetical protein B5M47_03500 [candidate division CPR3 bacterium 4484_211]|uniref:Uncharacterized protein n=1 Tax=candidate division CPR3 bacterium 4484_211 TaxID=1968527 RepID=A0A1W9NXA2_UNCC3|nr:MAG: hypothetical protein B5M47_03500 [candidate division CPR3 bacterium 4484_211]